MIFALIGNQNCGKTTLFNQLTGANQHVGNFPGVTVEKKEGILRKHRDVTVIDLPGIYSLSPYTAEEVVTRDLLLNDRPDGIINIVDATNIERNLYLTLQLLELDIPMILALNMMDEVRASGGTIDIDQLQTELQIPVVPISACKNEGVNELAERAILTVHQGPSAQRIDFCKGPIHKAIHAIAHLIEFNAERRRIPARFAATKLVEGDQPMIKTLDITVNDQHIMEHIVKEMEEELGTDREAAMADMRYEFIENLVADCCIKPRESKERLRSNRIDSLLTHKYLAIPIFLGIMLTIFWLTFNLIGAWLSDGLSVVLDGFTAYVDQWLTIIQVSSWMHSLLIDGVFSGVGSVLSFLPTIVVLFFFLSLLEDSGYMARVAFIMDKLLRKIGLSGRSFVPMLIGFGCSVPAIMATRTLSSRRDQKMTIILTPFISCSAKMPIYALFTAAFFADHRPLILLSLYLTGILVAVLVSLLLSHTLFRGNPVPFVMELPVYRLPAAKSVLMHMWEKAKDFLVKAFTVIFVATLVIWFLSNMDFHFNMVADSSSSMLASLGKIIAPVFAPMGFGNWQAATALITGLLAKEAVVSTLAVLVGTGEEGLSAVLTQYFSPLTAYAFLVFTLLYMPCVAALAATRREMGSTLGAVLVMLFQTTTAWLVSFLVYKTGGWLLSFTPFSNPIDWLLLALVLAAFLAAMVYMIRRRSVSPCGDCTACNSCPQRGQCTDEKR